MKTWEKILIINAAIVAIIVGFFSYLSTLDTMNRQQIFLFYMEIAALYSIMATGIIWTITLTLKTKRILGWRKILIINIITIATFVFLLTPLGMVGAVYPIQSILYWTLRHWITERLCYAIIVVALTWFIVFIRKSIKLTIKGKAKEA